MRIEDKLDELCSTLDRLVQQLDAPMPKVLTRERAAHELSVSLTTLKQMIRDGQLVTVSIGKRQMVPASEVMRLAKPAPAKKASSAHRPRAAASTALDEASAVRALLKKL